MKRQEARTLKRQLQRAGGSCAYAPAMVSRPPKRHRKRYTNLLIVKRFPYMARSPVKQVAASGVLGEARGRLLVELCGQPKSAAELAAQVGTSSNAVRVHLDGLRSAGLVDYQVQRRGVGKPTHVFALTTAAEYLVSSAYAPALRAIVETARRRLNGGVSDLLREAGATLVRQHESSARAPRGLATATKLLRELGSSPSVERAGDDHILRSACCPLGSVTRHDREVCTLLEGVLRAATGLQVREQCEHGEHPRCEFVVGKRPARTAGGGPRTRSKPEG
jgi:predicted ArsR family transcriptional regulator